MSGFSNTRIHRSLGPTGMISSNRNMIRSERREEKTEIITIARFAVKINIEFSFSVCSTIAVVILIACDRAGGFLGTRSYQAVAFKDRRIEHQAASFTIH